MSKTLYPVNHVKYEFPVIHIYDGISNQLIRKIPMLPIYLIAALKNDNETMQDLENGNYSNYFSLTGKFASLVNVDFTLEVDMIEKEYSIKEYSKKVLSKITQNNFQKINQFLSLMSFSQLNYLVLLYLLDNKKITLNDMQSFFALQYSNLTQKLINILETMEHVSYKKYIPQIEPVETPFLVSHSYQHNVSYNSVLNIDTTLIHSALSIYVLSRLYGSSDSPKSYFTKKINNKLCDENENDQEKYSLTELKTIFPFIRKIKNENDSFTSTGHTYYAYNDLKNQLITINKNIIVCEKIQYFKATDFNNNPIEMSIYNITSDLENKYIVDGIAYNANELNNKYHISEFYSWCVKTRLDDYEIIYLIDKTKMELQFINDPLNYINAYQDTINSTNIFSTDKSILKNSYFVDKQSSGNVVYLAEDDVSILLPNNSNLVYISYLEKFYCIPEVSLNFWNDKLIHKKLISNINKLLNTYSKNNIKNKNFTNLYKKCTAQLYDATPISNVLYKCSKFFNTYYMKISFSFNANNTDQSIFYLKDLLKKTKYNIYDEETNKLISGNHNIYLDNDITNIMYGYYIYHNYDPEPIIQHDYYGDTIIEQTPIFSHTISLLNDNVKAVDDIINITDTDINNYMSSPLNGLFLYNSQPYFETTKGEA